MSCLLAGCVCIYNDPPQDARRLKWLALRRFADWLRFVLASFPNSCHSIQHNIHSNDICMQNFGANPMAQSKAFQTQHIIKRICKKGSQRQRRSLSSNNNPMLDCYRIAWRPPRGLGGRRPHRLGPPPPPDTSGYYTKPQKTIQRPRMLSSMDGSNKQKNVFERKQTKPRFDLCFAMIFTILHQKWNYPMVDTRILV